MVIMSGMGYLSAEARPLALVGIKMTQAQDAAAFAAEQAAASTVGVATSSGVRTAPPVDYSKVPKATLPYGGDAGGLFEPGSFLHDYWKLGAVGLLAVGGFLWWRRR
jgi:hypothetical protein